MPKTKESTSAAAELHSSRLAIEKRWTEPGDDLSLLAFRLADIPAALEIELASFDHPWRQADYVRTLYLANCRGLVANRNERMAGFVVYQMQNDQLHILNLAVHPASRRQGIARSLIYNLLSRKAIDDFDTAMLKPGLVAHVQGRRVLALDGFEAALTDKAAKQRMWAYIKQLTPAAGQGALAIEGRIEGVGHIAPALAITVTDETTGEVVFP